MSFIWLLMFVPVCLWLVLVTLMYIATLPHVRRTRFSRTFVLETTDARYDKLRRRYFWMMVYFFLVLVLLLIP